MRPLRHLLRRATPCCWALLSLALSAQDSPLVAGPSGERSVDPPWAVVAPRHEELLLHDGSLTAEENGQRLREAVAALQPGTRLSLGGGTWSFEKRFELLASGTRQAPIWIEGRAGERVLLTRPDDRQNVLDVGNTTPGSVSFLVLRGLEITGGSAGVRLHGCRDLWFDGNEIHHTGAGALTANTVDATRLHITRNHIHHTAGFGEGMYLGANHGAVVLSSSVIALNHVHDCGGDQGDGIELKQGSHSNWIVANTVHDTRYPAILVYGTDGQPPNLVERNICWNSETNVMQVQGEALVRNNLLLGGQIGFHTHDHQGQSRDLVVVHNTIVSTGVGANLYSWNARPGMVFANNVVYAQAGPAVRCEQGSEGVTFAGNVVLGAVQGAPSAGFSNGRGLSDFEGLDWLGQTRDPRPAPGSPALGSAQASHAVWEDLFGRERPGRPSAGCAEPR